MACDTTLLMPGAVLSFIHLCPTSIKVFLQYSFDKMAYSEVVSVSLSVFGQYCEPIEVFCSSKQIALVSAFDEKIQVWEEVGGGYDRES